jgi:uncharacterized membrane protein
MSDGNLPQGSSGSSGKSAAGGGGSPAGAGASVGTAVAPVVERNMRALLQRQEEEHAQESVFQRTVVRISQVLGSFWFVAFHGIMLVVWVVVNAGWTPVRPFDPHFQVLGILASVECLFVTLLVLNRQNRMQRLADQRAELNLHISLLDEHETTRLIKLVADIARQVGAPVEEEHKLAALTEEVKPEQVIDELERQKAAPEGGRKSEG